MAASLAKEISPAAFHAPLAAMPHIRSADQHRMARSSPTAGGLFLDSFFHGTVLSFAS
jgi:hypothetical protein